MFKSFDVHATGMPVLDAQADFRRARRAFAMARLQRRLFRRHRGNLGPRSLSGCGLLPGGARRLEVVRLGSIVGTVHPTVDFDARFDVVDGRHRISVASRPGCRDIDARVTGIPVAAAVVPAIAAAAPVNAQRSR